MSSHAEVMQTYLLDGHCFVAHDESAEDNVLQKHQLEGQQQRVAVQHYNRIHNRVRAMAKQVLHRSEQGWNTATARTRSSLKPTFQFFNLHQCFVCVFLGLVHVASLHWVHHRHLEGEAKSCINKPLLASGERMKTQTEGLTKYTNTHMCSFGNHWKRSIGFDDWGSADGKKYNFQ